MPSRAVSPLCGKGFRVIVLPSRAGAHRPVSGRFHEF